MIALVTHGLFMPGAADVIADPAIDRLAVSDTVPPFRLDAHARRDKIDIVPAAPLLAETIRRLLVDQVTSMVRWRESVLYMKEQGVTLQAELGAGRVLSGLARRIDRDLEAVSCGQPDEIEAVLKKL